MRTTAIFHVVLFGTHEQIDVVSHHQTRHLARSKRHHFIYRSWQPRRFFANFFPTRMNKNVITDAPIYAFFLRVFRCVRTRYACESHSFSSSRLQGKMLFKQKWKIKGGKNSWGFGKIWEKPPLECQSTSRGHRSSLDESTTRGADVVCLISDDSQFFFNILYFV